LAVTEAAALEALIGRASEVPGSDLEALVSDFDSA